MTVITSGAWPVDPTTTSGTELAAYLNELVNAIQTAQASPSRPPALQKGGVWAKTLGAADIALMFFDGTTDHEIGSVIGGNVSFGGVSAATTAPTPATLGQTWVDTTIAGAPILKVYNGTIWEDIGGSASSPTFNTVTATTLLGDGSGITGLYADSDVDAHLNYSTATTGQILSYSGSDYAWVAPNAGGGLFKGENGEVGSSAGDIFRINEQELNTSTTIDADENASATGPLTIATGVTLIVTAGGNLSIV